jgi:hypothetical protein
MFGVLRIAVGICSVLFLLAGLFLVAGGGAPIVSGLWLLVLGGVGLVVVAFETRRYGSEATELQHEPVGGAGVETGAPEPRFRPTEERFIDPTTRKLVRVWMDPRTGERRYRLDDEATR